MIAALLPGLAKDLSVTLTAAGQLVTVFGLTYAVSSPALSALRRVSCSLVPQGFTYRAPVHLPARS
jgi:hypothetical protein